MLNNFDMKHFNNFIGGLGTTGVPDFSDFAATPLTTSLDTFTYRTNATLPTDWEFVCCTLNGRLLCYTYVLCDEDGFPILDSDYDEQINYVYIPIVPDYMTGHLSVRQDMAIIVPEKLYADCEELGWDYPIARGVDWILTNYLIFQVYDEPPYIRYAQTRQMSRAFMDYDMYYLYSEARTLSWSGKVGSVYVGPAIDPISNVRWGSQAGGEGGALPASLGTIQPYEVDTRIMESCYSTLPNIGDWIMIEDYLIRRPIAPINDYRTIIINAKPLIPLEFNLYPIAMESSGLGNVFPTYGIGHSTTRRMVQVAAIGNELWARGLMHFGRAYILPAVIGDDEEELSYFLYISNSSNCVSPFSQWEDQSIDENNDWLKLAIAPLKIKEEPKEETPDKEGEDDPDKEEDEEDAKKPVERAIAVGFLSENGDPLNGSFCTIPKEGKILVPNDPEGGVRGRWMNPIEYRTPIEGEDLYLTEDIKSCTLYDASSKLGLTFHEVGMMFLGGKSDGSDIEAVDDYTCATLPTWVSPSVNFEDSTETQIESFNTDYVISSDDNNHYMTEIPCSMHRTILPKMELPICFGALQKHKEVELTEKDKEKWRKENPDKDEKDMPKTKIVDAEKIQFGFGMDEVLAQKEGVEGLIPVTNIKVMEYNAPDDAQTSNQIAWEDVYRNPFSIRMLKSADGSAVGGWMAGGFTELEPKSGWGTWTRATYVQPRYPMLFKRVSKSHIEFAFIDPETGNINPRAVYFTLEGRDPSVVAFPVLKDNEDFLIEYAEYPGQSRLEHKYISTGITLPSYLEGWNFVDRFAGSGTGDHWNAKYNLWAELGSCFWNFPALNYYGDDEDIATNYDHRLCLEITEQRTQTWLFYKSSAFGSADPLWGMWKERVNSKILPHCGAGQPAPRKCFFTYGADLHDSYDGLPRYNKGLYIFTASAGDYIPCNNDISDTNWYNLTSPWLESHLYIIRADYDPTVFDIDEEMLKSKTYYEKDDYDDEGGDTENAENEN